MASDWSQKHNSLRRRDNSCVRCAPSARIVFTTKQTRLQCVESGRQSVWPTTQWLDKVQSAATIIPPPSNPPPLQTPNTATQPPPPQSGIQYQSAAFHHKFSENYTLQSRQSTAVGAMVTCQFGVSTLARASLGHVPVWRVPLCVLSVWRVPLCVLSVWRHFVCFQFDASHFVAFSSLVTFKLLQFMLIIVHNYMSPSRQLLICGTRLHHTWKRLMLFR